jgi:hypothetical protein|tara:strand:+ start:1939 stop:2298 length:360 start_codon:yes stop_codon:yes gene_type:complete
MATELEKFFVEEAKTTIPGAAARFGIDQSLLERASTRRQALPHQLAEEIGNDFDGTGAEVIAPFVRIIVGPRTIPSAVWVPAPPYNKTTLTPIPPREILGETFRAAEYAPTVDVPIPSP